MLTQCIVKEQSIENNNLYVFSIAPGVIDTNMQNQIRIVNKTDFSRLDKFIQLKDSGSLKDPYQVARKYVELIEHPEKIHHSISTV